MEEKRIKQKPKSCFECISFGKIGIETVFPSLCEKNLLWFKCIGKEGIKGEKKRILQRLRSQNDM